MGVAALLILNNSFRMFFTFFVAIIICCGHYSVNSVGTKSCKNFSRNLYYEEKSGMSGLCQKIAKHDGQLILGAMLPIHISSADLCSRVYVDGMMLVEAIRFALRKVKSRISLPESVSLGYEIRDTCSSVIIAQRHTLGIVLDIEKKKIARDKLVNTTDSYTSNLNDFKSSRGNIIAVVGAGNSEVSVAVNRVLSAFNIPQIGFASTSRYLSEKLRFPSFFRTVPPDTYQVQALLALLEKFSWNYVGLLLSGGDYGRALAESFRSLAKEKGVCIAYEYVVPYSVSSNTAKNIAKSLKEKTKIEIIIILLPEIDVKTLLTAMTEIGFQNKILIASDSWSKAIRDIKFSKIVSGTLGFAHHYTRVTEFEEYFLGLRPSNNTWNPWFNETWEHIFKCKISGSNNAANKTRSIDMTTSCNLRTQRLKREHFTGFHYVSNIINAVFAVVTGIKNSFNNKQSTVFSLTSNELLDALNEMTFQKYNGQNIRFDKNGDIGGKYNLVNIYSDLTAKNIGIWDGQYLKITHPEKIQWNSERQNSPNGRCSTQCSPGWYQLSTKKDPQCCWNCKRCLAGTITNQSGATSCVSCPEDHVTNRNQSACIYIPLKYLDWRSFWTISIIILALVSVTVLLTVVTLFVRFANTPVVKSSNRELSLLLCVGLFLTFLVPFVFAGKPSKLKCIISQVIFCVGCALALSAMLFRTLRIVLVFGLANRRGSWLLKNKYQIVLTLALTFSELIYCLLWIAVKPPEVKTVTLRPTKRYLVCNFDKYWYGGSHILLIILSLLCTALAVKGRKLPKNFNEVRHIGLSMFTFNIVWVVFMCAQYGASLEYDVKINCFAMIISSLMILLLLFGPKVYILLFRSHLNKKEEFQKEVRRYSFGLPNGNISTSDISLKVRSSLLQNSFNDQFLTVATSNDPKRLRSRSFDVTEGRHYQRPLQSYSKATQTVDFPNDPSSECSEANILTFPVGNDWKIIKPEVYQFISSNDARNRETIL